MHAEPSTDPHLAIYLLGRPEYRRGNEVLPPLATHKTQSLLAYLILYRHRPCSRDELAALFWSDRDDVHARRSLSTALWRIRRLLGEDRFLADSTSVQFIPAPSFWLDVAEFEKHLAMARQEPEEKRAVGHWREAVDLYRGDLLEGFYDDWCLEERYRLESLYLDALARLVAWYDSQGDAGATLTYARKYLARDPLTEHMHLALMRALATLGDMRGARRQWQICCETRQQELHLPPSPQMIQQAQNILGEYFTMPLPAEPLPARAPPRWGSLERPPFVGRRSELAALWARWEQAVQGQGGIIWIGGEAGVGKTRLAEELAALVRRRGGIVVRGRCYEPEQGLPYQALTEVLRDLTVQEGQVGAQHAAPLPGWAHAELARLLPEILAQPTPPKPPPDPLQPERQAIPFHAVATFIRHFASRTPLLIVLEDLHWASDSMLAAIHYLVRQAQDTPVLLLATFRPEEVGETRALARMMAQLARDGLAQHLALERLSVEAISELVRRTFQVEAEGEFVNRLYMHTDGNAFFTIETLRALAGTALPAGPLPVPGNVRALVESRLGHLSAPAREWIACAAVAGRAFDFDLVRRVSGMGEDAALEVLDELLRQGFLCEGSGIVGRDYEFVHHLVQEVTSAGIHHRRRRRLHRLIGEAMEGLYADQPADALAHHFDAGGDAEKALHYHSLAAQQAAAAFAWQEAEEHQSRMLQLLEELDPDGKRPDCLRCRGQVLTARAESRYLQARLAERDADLAVLAALAESGDDDVLRLQSWMQRARYLNLDAQYEQAIVASDQGLALADRQNDVAARCYLLTQIGFAYYFLGRPQPALTALESALAMVPPADCETRRHITHILGYVYFHMGDYARALAYQQESHAAHQASGDYSGVAWAGLDIGATYGEMGHPAEAERYLTEHLDLARRIGARSAEAYGLIQLGSWELGRGHYVAAADFFQQALPAQEGLRTEHGRAAAELGAGFAFYHLGDAAEARRWLEQAIERARRIGHRRRLLEALIGLGLAEMAAGQPQAAHGCLTEAVAMARESESQGNLAAGLAALARAERRLGDLAASLEHASESVQFARQIAAPVYEMWGELEVGLTLLAQGAPEAALEHSGRTVALAPCSGEGWIGTEQAHRAHARVLRALGRMEEAQDQDHLAEAIITAKADRIPDAGQRQRYLQAARREP